MREVQNVLKAMAHIADRYKCIGAEMQNETRDGLDADWSAVAEMFESIKNTAEHAAASAWRVAYESQPAMCHHDHFSIEADGTTTCLDCGRVA